MLYRGAGVFSLFGWHVSSTHLTRWKKKLYNRQCVHLRKRIKHTRTNLISSPSLPFSPGARVASLFFFRTLSITFFSPSFITACLALAIVYFFTSTWDRYRSTNPRLQPKNKKQKQKKAASSLRYRKKKGPRQRVLIACQACSQWLLRNSFGNSRDHFWKFIAAIARVCVFRYYPRKNLFFLSFARSAAAGINASCV